MGTLLARNATILVTMDDQRRELPGAGLFARDGVIEQVGPSAELPSDADVVLELPGHLLMPGLVNCHHHLDQVLTRNLPAGQNTNLFPWLRAHYRLWGRRTPPASRTATIVGLAELALSGATTVFDHAYVFGNGCRVDDQIAAAAEVGTRFVVSRGSMSLGESRGGLPPDDCVEDEDAILTDSQRVIERYHDPRAGSMCQIALAPCSPFSVTPELMRDSAALARRYGVRLHTHLAETLDEERYTLATLGRRPLDYLDPRRAADWMTAREALGLGTCGGAAVLGRTDIGSLEPGKCADFFTLDLATLGYAGGLSDPVAAAVFCAPQRARHTVINGRVVVADGEVVTLDLEPVITEHNRHAAALAAGADPGSRQPGI